MSPDAAGRDPALLPAAPAALRDAASGFPAFGRYAGLIRDLSTASWDGTLSLASPRRTQRKGWVFLGAFSPRFMAGFAIVDAGLVGTAFCYVYDREAKVLVEDKATVPLAFARAFEPRLDAPWALTQGDRRWSFAPQARGWSAQFAGQRLRLQIEVGHDGNGMSTIAGAPGRPFNFTYKDCDLPLRLQLSLDGQRHELDARGMVDFTLGYPPRRTFWNWAAGAGEAGGRRLGFNLVAHFNNGLENALWVDGRVVPLAQASFVYDPSALEAPWRVTTADGVLDLSFAPEGRRAENINAIVLGSRFVQLFGTFAGSLRLDGRSHAITASGVTEEHRAVW